MSAERFRLTYTTVYENMTRAELEQWVSRQRYYGWKDSFNTQLLLAGEEAMHASMDGDMKIISRVRAEVKA